MPMTAARFAETSPGDSAILHAMPAARSRNTADIVSEEYLTLIYGTNHNRNDSAV